MGGICFVVRGLVRLKRTKFNKPAVTANSMLLLLSAVSVVIPCVHNATSLEPSRLACTTAGQPRTCTTLVTVSISRAIAIVLLICYVTMLIWSTLTHKHLLLKRRSWNNVTPDTHVEAEMQLEEEDSHVQKALLLSEGPPRRGTR